MSDKELKNQDVEKSQEQIKKEREEREEQLIILREFRDIITEGAGLKTEDNTTGFSEDFIGFINDDDNLISFFKDKKSFYKKIKKEYSGDERLIEDLMSFYTRGKIELKSLNNSEEHQPHAEYARALSKSFESDYYFFEEYEKYKKDNPQSDLTKSMESVIASSTYSLRRNSTKEIKGMTKAQKIMDSRKKVFSLLDGLKHSVMGGEVEYQSPVFDFYKHIIDDMEHQFNNAKPNNLAQRIHRESVVKAMNESPHAVTVDTGLMIRHLQEDLKEKRNFLENETRLDSITYQRSLDDFRKKERMLSVIEKQHDLSMNRALVSYVKQNEKIRNFIDGKTGTAFNSYLSKFIQDQKDQEMQEFKEGLNKKLSDEELDLKIKQKTEELEKKYSESSKFIDDALLEYAQSNKDIEMGKLIDKELKKERARIEKEIEKRDEYLKKIAEQSYYRNKDGDIAISVGKKTSSHFWLNGNSDQENDISLPAIKKIKDRKILGITLSKEFIGEGGKIMSQDGNQFNVLSSATDDERMDAIRLAVNNLSANGDDVHIAFTKSTKPEFAKRALNEAVNIMYKNEILMAGEDPDSVSDELRDEIKNRILSKLNVKGGGISRNFDMDKFLEASLPQPTLDVTVSGSIGIEKDLEKHLEQVTNFESGKKINAGEGLVGFIIGKGDDKLTIKRNIKVALDSIEGDDRYSQLGSALIELSKGLNASKPSNSSDLKHKFIERVYIGDQRKEEINSIKDDDKKKEELNKLSEQLGLSKKEKERFFKDFGVKSDDPSRSQNQRNSSKQKSTPS